MSPNPTVIHNKTRYRSTGHRWVNGILFTLMAAVILTGCTPPWADAMLEGKTQLDNGQFKEAISSFKQTTRLKPELARAWNYLGLAYHKDGQYAQARDAYTKAYNINNNLAEAVFNLGCLRLETRVYDDAINQFKTYQMLRPQSTAALHYQALAHIALNELLEAQDIYDRLLRQSPEDAKAFNGMGLIQQRKGNNTESYNYFHTALERDAAYTPALWNKGMIAHPALQRPDLAVQNLRKFTFKAPQSPLVPIAKSIAESIEASFFKQKTPEVEIPTETTKETDENTDDQELATQDKETSPAEAAIDSQSNAQSTPSETVLNKEPEENDPNTNTQSPPPEDTANLVVKNETEAPEQPEVKEITPVKPSVKNDAPPAASSASQTNVVVKADVPKEEETKASEDVGEPEEDKEDPETVVKIERPVIIPPSAPGVTPLPQGRTFNPYRYLLPGAPLAGNRQVAAPLFDRANKALQRSDFEEAITQYERAVSADPSFFEAYFNLGLAALNGGNADKALPAYEYALAISPQHRDSRYNLALALIKKDHLRDAARELETLLKADPSDRPVLMRLGELYSGPLQRPVRTREVYQQLLKAGPTPGEVSTARSWLRSNP